MRIAQVAPLAESVPPRSYGGTERVVSYLTEELVELGHDVVLFASGDSTTRAELVPVCEQALRTAGCRDPVPHHVALVEEVARRLDEFDVAHFHIDCLHFPMISRHSTVVVTTLHGRLDLPDLTFCYRRFSHLPFVSISDAQRAPMPWLNWTRTVHHGLPVDLYPFGEGRGGYLAFLGRICRDKGPLEAIEIARRSRLPLKIAAKVDPVDRAYFEDAVMPVLRGGGVEFLGEIDDAAKARLLGDALGLLFPIDWPEPFGLVTIESLACGTPVVAFPRGAVPEILEDGRTGFLATSVDHAVECVASLESLDRRACRAAFESRFSRRRMALDYLSAYERLIALADGRDGFPRRRRSV